MPKKLDLIQDHVVHFEHQVTAIREMARMTSVLLADVMGLGKTLTAMSAMAIAWQMNEAKQGIVVAPASLKGNWGDEFDDMTHFTWRIVEGTPKQRVKQIEEYDSSESDILIVNYEQLKPHLDQLNAIQFGIALYDEAHYIKSPSSKRTKSVFGLRANRHFLLTGSPIMNQVNDLWALLHRIAPADWGSYRSFVNRYCVFGGYQDKQIIGIMNETELREKLNRYMIRRTKDELDLPGKLPINYIKVPMHPEQKKMYDQAVEELRIEWGDGSGDEYEIKNAMVKLLRLRQICGTTATMPGHEDHSIKLDVLVEKVRELIDSGEPVVVFGQFREVQRCFHERLIKAGIKFYELNGDVPKQNRKPIVKLWSKAANEGTPSVMSSTIQVGGTGLTMVEANHVFFIDRDWSPKLNEQAEDRLDRIGQTKPVSVHVMQVRGSVEQRVEKVNKVKSDIFDAVIEKQDTAWKKKILQAIMNQEPDDD